MMTREQFGPYLLLKKLAEDPLGETFRAGRLGRGDVEQVVLLRVFNGSALEGQDLWGRVARRKPVQLALKSPNIGNGVDLGEVQGVPYVAYDYISGKNLASVFEQVIKGSQPVPLEHALLIAERLALGLAVAYETRVDDARILHGFLVPQLLLLSNEGENRLLGFEVGPGLRALVSSGPLREAFGRYQSPEALAGGPPSKKDDVYSLGAILLELLLGRQLPAPGENGHQNLVLEITERGLAEVGYLLGRSLAPAKERLGNVVSWHKSLSKILIDGGYKATTFNLAFFMHNLFRDDIEKESQEIELEKTIRLEPSALRLASSPPPASTGSLSGPTSGPMSATTPTSTLQIPALRTAGPPSGALKAPRRRRGLVPLVAALVAVVLGVGGYLGWQQFRSATGANAASDAPAPLLAAATEPFSPSPVTVEVLATPEAKTEPEAAPAGPSRETLRQQIDDIVAERTRSMERSLRAAYDDEIASLRAQLEAAQQAQEEARVESARSEPIGEELGQSQNVAAAAAPPLAAQERNATAPEGAAQPLPREVPPGASDIAALQPEPADSPGSLPPVPATTQERPDVAPASAAAAVSRPVAERSPSPPPPPPRPRRVRRGDLVPLSAGVVPPKLRDRLDPRYPIMAQKVKKEATILLSVLVDENGRVSEVKMPEKKAGFGFDDAAHQAAKRARFEPATKDGVEVKTWTSIRIEFKLR